MDKATVRRQTLEAIAAAPVTDPARVEEAIQAVLDGVTLRTGALLGYLPLPDELDVRGVMQRWQAQGGVMAIPSTNWETHTITPCRVDALDDSAVIERRHGLLEPRVISEVPVSDLAAVLVPGVAFDRQGGRIGRGKGFYDRLLSRLPDTTPRLAVCRRVQLVDHVPMDAHDERVHQVIVVD